MRGELGPQLGKAGLSSRAGVILSANQGGYPTQVPVQGHIPSVGHPPLQPRQEYLLGSGAAVRQFAHAEANLPSSVVTLGPFDTPRSWQPSRRPHSPRSHPGLQEPQPALLPRWTLSPLRLRPLGPRPGWPRGR